MREIDILKKLTTLLESIDNEVEELDEMAGCKCKSCDDGSMIVDGKCESCGGGKEELDEMIDRPTAQRRTLSEMAAAGPITDEHGIKYYYNADGKLDRKDGPAVIHPDDTEEEKHREYWVDGQQHNAGGPAVIDDENGWEEYWLNGEEMSDREHHDSPDTYVGDDSDMPVRQNEMREGDLQDELLPHRAAKPKEQNGMSLKDRIAHTERPRSNKNDSLRDRLK